MDWSSYSRSIGRVLLQPSRRRCVCSSCTYYFLILIFCDELESAAVLRLFASRISLHLDTILHWAYDGLLLGLWLSSLYHTTFFSFPSLNACVWLDEEQRTAKVQRLRIRYHDIMGGVHGRLVGATHTGGVQVWVMLQRTAWLAGWRLQGSFFYLLSGSYFGSPGGWMI